MKAKPVVAPRLRDAAANSDSSAVFPLIEEEQESVLPTPIISDERSAELVEDVRGQATAAADMLVNLKDQGHDDALRNEIADIAAKMIAILGQKEGANSPIRSMISGRPGLGQNGRVPLSERAAKLIHQE
jgi:hypothetical protein